MTFRPPFDPQCDLTVTHPLHFTLCCLGNLSFTVQRTIVALHVVTLCRCLYISGVPGTGKTATVHEVMCSLKEAEEEGLVPQFRFVEINGMRMTDPYQTYPLIWKVCIGRLGVCMLVV